VFGLTKYHLRERRLDVAAYDILDPESEVVVGVACPGAVEAAKKKPIETAPADSLPDRLLRVVAPAIFLFGLVRAIFGRGFLVPPSRNSRPRLIVRRPDDGGVVLTLRVSSGLLYDSRRVYDGQGGLVAHFRSRSKTTVRGGFVIIDLRGCEEDRRDISDRPLLGSVEPSGGVYRLRLADNPDAGRITPHTAWPENDPPETMVREGVDHYDIDASASLRQDATGEILLLAVALTVAWSPPPG
jgi:hypothetical protein